MISSKETFISLVKRGVGHSMGALAEQIDWVAIKDLAIDNGLTAIVLDGVESIAKKEGLLRGQEMNPLLKKQWIGQVIQNYECRYELYKRAIAGLSDFYGEYGFRMMVLKGFACSLDWPNPEHRPCGDIDIWQFGNWKEADKILAKKKGVKINHSHQHHTVFGWNGFFVENHYDFVNVFARKSNAEIEHVFKELGADDSHFVEVYGARVYLPSPNLHALFLIWHAATHFASSRISLRQVLDWAFFAEKHGREVDWGWLVNILDEFGMKPLFDFLNGICVEDLGFSIDIFPYIQFEPLMKDRVLEDILTPEFDRENPNRFLMRVWYKYRRWQANAWKRHLCYKESQWSAFWSGVWNHLMKPKSI